MTGDQNPGTQCGAVSDRQHDPEPDRCEFPAGHGPIPVEDTDYTADHGAPSVGHYWTDVPAPAAPAPSCGQLPGRELGKFCDRGYIVGAHRRLPDRTIECPADFLAAPVPTPVVVGPDDRVLISWPPGAGPDARALQDFRRQLGEAWGAESARRVLFVAEANVHVLDAADWQLDEEKEHTEMPHVPIVPQGPGEDMTALAAPDGPTGFQTPGEILDSYSVGEQPALPSPGPAEVWRDWLAGHLGNAPDVEVVRDVTGLVTTLTAELDNGATVEFQIRITEAGQ